MAGATRFELATSGVTGRRSNQLNYAPGKTFGFTLGYWLMASSYIQTAEGRYSWPFAIGHWLIVSG